MSSYQDRYIEEEYVFRKPGWRRAVPIVLILFTWILPLFLWKAPAIRIPGPLTENIQFALDWLAGQNVTLEKSVMVASGVTFVLLLWLMSGLEKLIISSEYITRRLPFGIRRTMKWVNLDEVLIDHVEARFEGEATIKKIMTLFAVRRPFMPWRRSMTITNRQFDDYEEVERLAMEVSIPAIAQRRREEIESTGKPATFAIREPGDAAVATIFTVLGVALLALAAYDAMWRPSLAFLRPYLAGVSGVLVLLAARKLLFKQLGVDMTTVYVMRRFIVRRRIPIDSIADVRIKDNQMRIFAYRGKSDKPKQVFKTNCFVRNRGVLLSLIREAYDARQAFDATPIAHARPTPQEEEYGVS